MRRVFADTVCWIALANRGITEVLMHDRHFAQEGLTILL
jgi:hypothetical protein